MGRCSALGLLLELLALRWRWRWLRNILLAATRAAAALTSMPPVLGLGDRRTPLRGGALSASFMSSTCSGGGGSGSGVCSVR
ncbi:hypothetical protein E2562_025831 [Oryza meyeriana var. granulata]|uniref:Uncharacterized protein n=1 Tax=Oryza meyeriana var. granulata TaxID=110450 RepID=A0A6G1E0R3_9ORYZ|nr:hypothetical protein E2562_025831 [Oryza meyeriana var. granulata]